MKVESLVVAPLPPARPSGVADGIQIWLQRLPGPQLRRQRRPITFTLGFPAHLCDRAERKVSSESDAREITYQHRATHDQTTKRLGSGM